MTIQEAQQYERRVPDAEVFSEGLETGPSFIPGTAAINGIAGSSGKFDGIFAGNTTYDYQHNGSCERQIQTGLAGGKRLVHCTWMVQKTPVYSDPNRQVNYNVYDWTVPGWKLGADDYGGISITPGVRSGYAVVDVNSAGNAVISHHTSNGSRVVRFTTPGLGDYAADELARPPGTNTIWPHISVGKDASDVYHVIAEDSNKGAGDPAIYDYWRYVNPGTGYVWQGPVVMDSSLTLSQVIRANGNRVVYALSKPRDYGTSRTQYDNDVAFYESTTGGADWITNNGPTAWGSGGGWNVTNYQDSDPHRAYIDLAMGV